MQRRLTLDATVVRKANDLVAEMTVFNCKRRKLASKTAISREDMANHRAIGKLLRERGK